MTKLFVFQKHSHTDHWVSYLEGVKAFNAETDPDLKDEFAEATVEEYNTLKKSSFFYAYASLRKEWVDLHPPIAKHLNLLPKWIKDAAIQYFMDKFKIPESCITCKDVFTGTRSAIHCSVNVGGIVYEYRIKTNHGVGTNSKGNFTYKCYSLCYLSLICLISFHFSVSFQTKFD